MLLAVRAGWNFREQAVWVTAVVHRMKQGARLDGLIQQGSSYVFILILYG